MADTSSAGSAAAWSASAGSAAAPRTFPWRRVLPFVGPVALFIVWDLVVRLGLIKVILLPTPASTLATLVTGLAGGPLLTDFLVTVSRTLQAFRPKS